jgi:D-alanine-D-alanine ligase
VKPQFGDASDRIANGALVRTEGQLLKRLQKIRARSHEPLLCEEFVAGRDLFVALLGNEPRVMPPLELVIGRSTAGAPRFATFKVKHDARYRRRWGIRYRRAELDEAQLGTIDEASRRIFRALKLRDYARIDYRLTPEGRLVFLEANPNPDLARHTFGHDVCFAGVPYPQLIGSIVSAALEREG